MAAAQLAADRPAAPDRAARRGGPLLTAPRPHLLAVSGTARRANRLLEIAWDRGLLSEIRLDPQLLWEVGAGGSDPADEHAGRAPAEVADFRLRLERLCAALGAEADLNALGKAMAYGQITGAIRKRLALGSLWRRRPLLPRTSLAAPIIVVGQMRSGTTRLHRLLAADPAHAATRFCDALDPVPARPDWRPLKAAAALAIARRINPWMDAIHPFGARRADEEIGWLAGALSPASFEAQWRIPSYVAFSEDRDPLPIYREFARVLATDAAHHGTAHRPRVLKCPQFAEDLATLLADFPTARVVVAQREPEAVLASTLSLVASQTAFQTARPDLAAIEREWRRKLALRERRVEAALAGWGGPVAHVDYAALDAEWQGAMRRIYAALGLTLDAEALAAMAGEQRRARRGPHHAHAAHLAPRLS